MQYTNFINHDDLSCTVSKWLDEVSIYMYACFIQTSLVKLSQDNMLFAIFIWIVWYMLLCVIFNRTAPIFFVQWKCNWYHLLVSSKLSLTHFCLLTTSIWLHTSYVLRLKTFFLHLVYPFEYPLQYRNISLSLFLRLRCRLNFL